jgi:hypothetical protein
MGRSATIRMGDYISQPFPILNGTPQGSPLSPILSALYTSPLLEIAKSWEHADLSLYVDDGAIYTVSATLKAATKSTRSKYEAILAWLHTNGLQTDAAKTELMTFVRKCNNLNLIGSPIQGARYTIPTGPTYHVSTVKSLWYLGVYLDHRLDWTRHVTIMANRARSTIRGVSLLGNSVRGLDFLNWRKVYNALIIPTLTYGAQVWYTGKRQKSLVHRLQVAQNEGLRKMTGVFKTTPTDPLHNLTGVPPVSYVLSKLMHAYSNRLQGLPARAKVRTILSEDQCRYWPDYITPMTNLRAAFRAPSTYPPWVEG